MDTINQLKSAKSASGKLAKSSNKERNEALELISKELLLAKDQILAKNKKDIEEGKKNNLSNALLDRLLLNEKRLSGMTESIKKVIFQPDPLGKVLKTWKHPNGMNIKQISLPPGFIFITYQARPNVPPAPISLPLKSGNPVIWKVIKY